MTLETPDPGDPGLAADEPHADVRRVMEQRESFRPLPLPTLGARGARLLTKLGQWFQDGDPPPVGAATDLPVPGPADDVPVRRYRPRGSGPFPTVVCYHGGGWVLGDLDTHDRFCRHLTVESGCEVVSVDYRRAPEHPFPAAVEDAYAALEWAGAGPDALEPDGTLAVVGDSAGGNLAAVAALMADERDGPALDYQVLVYPVVATDEDDPSMKHTGYVLEAGDLAWFDDCYYGSDLHHRNPYADPMQACDLSGVAPATVLTAGFDPLRDGGLAYARRLESDDVPVRVRNYPEMVHGFVTMLSESEDVDRAHEAVATIGSDLRRASGLESE
jgi:acetyl esterase